MLWMGNAKLWYPYATSLRYLRLGGKQSNTDDERSVAAAPANLCLLSTIPFNSFHMIEVELSDASPTGYNYDMHDESTHFLPISYHSMNYHWLLLHSCQMQGIITTSQLIETLPIAEEIGWLLVCEFTTDYMTCGQWANVTVTMMDDWQNKVGHGSNQ